MDETEANDELTAACSSLADLMAYLMSGGMNMWQAPTAAVPGGFTGYTTGLQIRGDEIRNLQMGMFYWTDTVPSPGRIVKHLGRMGLLNTIRDTALEEGGGTNIRRVIIDRMAEMRARRRARPAVVVDLNRPLLHEAFDRVSTRICAPAGVTVDNLRSWWCHDFLESIVDIALDTEGGEDWGLASVSVSLQGHKGCHSLSVYAFSVADRDVFRLRLIDVFGAERLISSWGGSEHVSFSGLNVVDVQTVRLGRSVSLVDEFNRHQDGTLYRKDIESRMYFWDPWPSFGHWIAHALEVVPNSEEVLALMVAGNEAAIRLCVADTLAILSMLPHLRQA